MVACSAAAEHVINFSRKSTFPMSSTFRVSQFTPCHQFFALSQLSPPVRCVRFFFFFITLEQRVELFEVYEP